MAGVTREWEVDTKGGPMGTFEISVVHKDFEHGRRSYGWFGPQKVLISVGTSGSGTHEQMQGFVWDQLINLARNIRNLLNDGCVRIEEPERKLPWDE